MIRAATVDKWKRSIKEKQQNGGIDVIIEDADEPQNDRSSGGKDTLVFASLDEFEARDFSRWKEYAPTHSEYRTPWIDFGFDPVS